MWFFMISCYVLTVVTFIMLLLNGLQGYFHFALFHAGHPTFAILTIIFYLFTESLVIFYFVGIGVSIRDYVQANKLSNEFLRRSMAVKRKVYPPLLLNMLIIMVLFVSGGAVATRRLPGWLHGVLFFIGIIHFVKVIVTQHRAFKDSTAIVLDMSGIER